MADDVRPQDEDREAARLPSERETRRQRRRLLALLLSLLVHVGLVAFAILVARGFNFGPPPPSVRVEPESMTVRFSDQRVKIPELTPPDTNVIAEENAVARSPGEDPPTPHGETEMPDPDRGPRVSPEPPPAAEETPRQEETEPRPPDQRSDQRTESIEDKRRRIADALGRMGSPGGTGEGSWADSAGEPSSGIGFSFGGGGMQIESRSDIDWGPWARKVQEEVKANWYSIMPVAARVSMKGVVVVRFQVQRDGEITDYETLESSGVPPLDQAVHDALLRMSSPLPPLPVPEDGEESIRITYTFIYNLDDDREIRAWRRLNWARQRGQSGGG